MTDRSDDDAFEAWRNSEPVLKRLRSLWEAEKAAREINDPMARDAARTTLGAVTGAFLDAAGVTTQLQQQMIDHALGEPGADTSFAGKTFAELTRPEMLRSRGGEAFLRAIAERGFLTLSGLLGGTFSTIAAGNLRDIGKGYRGLFSFRPKAGVNPDGGLAHALQEATVGALGYTVGATGVGQAKKALLQRAVTYYDNRAALYGLPRTNWHTVREWTQRAHAEHYRKTVREGIDDRQKGKLDATKQL